MDAFVFTGQGSQKVGMGAGLFDGVSEFTRVEKEIDDLLGYSVRSLCLHDAEKKLNNTAYTQPALYIVNALHYYNALSKGMRPRLVAGHSLGEYNALLAAGVYDLLTGLRLVQKRGELMAQARDGGMAAVIGMHADDVEALVRDNEWTTIDVANFNSPRQTVISGPLDDIQRAGPIFQEAGAQNYVVLPVSAAFHSRYMKPAAVEFDRFLSDIRFRDPDITVIANVTARPYQVGTPDVTVRELLVKQISSPVRWTDTVQYLLGRGTSTFHEMGPGEVLTRLVHGIRQH